MSKELLNYFFECVTVYPVFLCQSFYDSGICLKHYLMSLCVKSARIYQSLDHLVVQISNAL